MASSRNMSLPLKGIVPPVVTPLRGRDELDVAGLERLVEHIVPGGVSALFILGTTGEGPSLSYRLRREMVERVCRLARGRVPVLVGITDTAFVESVQLAGYAAEKGAKAVVTAPPYYLPEGQPELQEWLNHLVPELPLPLFLYNMPSLTKVSFEIATVRRAMDNPGIVGLKDSSGNLDYFRSACVLLPHRPDWSLLMGPQELLVKALQSGGSGGVSGGANVFPRLYVELYKAVCANDTERVRELDRAVARLAETLFHVGRHPSSLIKGLKCALACLGICDDFMAEPFHRFRAEDRTRLEGHLAELKARLNRLGIPTTD